MKSGLMKAQVQQFMALSCHVSLKRRLAKQEHAVRDSHQLVHRLKSINHDEEGRDSYGKENADFTSRPSSIRR